MGSNKKANRRRSRNAGMVVESIVEVIKAGVEVGIITLPKSVYHYRRAILAALDGDLTQLEAAMNNVISRGCNIVTMDADGPTINRWKVGMKDSLEGCYYVLSKYHQMLKEYHAIRNPTPDKILGKFIRSGNWQGNKLVRKPQLPIEQHS